MENNDTTESGSYVNKEVNPQVVEAVCVTNVSVVGMAPGESQAMAYESLSHSLALLMHNSTATQHAAQQIGIAAVSKTCAIILKQG